MSARGLAAATQGVPGRLAPPPGLAPPSFLETVGCEFEVLGDDARALHDRLRAAHVRTGAPQQLSRLDAARLWLGLSVNLPGKGQDHGVWRVVPELAFPLDSHEVVSPALPYARAGEILRVGQALDAHGVQITGDGAFHVHVAHDDLLAAQIVDVVRLWAQHQPMVFALGNTNLRQQQLYARPLEPAFLQALQDQPPQTKADLHALYMATHRPVAYSALGAHAARFYSLNLHYLGAGHTLEFRPYQLAPGALGEGAQAFVDLSLAVVAAAREGRASALLQERFDPAVPGDAEAFLDALGLTAALFPASRAQLLSNLQRPRGFALFDGELRTLAHEGALAGLVTGASVLAGSLRGARWRAGLRRGLVLAAEGALLAAGLHATALLAEGRGAATYAHTYAAREWTPAHFALIGAAWRGVAAMGADMGRMVGAL